MNTLSISGLNVFFSTEDGPLHALKDVAFDVPELEGPGPGWPEGRLQHLLLAGGAALLTISALLDRVFLKGDAPGAGR